MKPGLKTMEELLTLGEIRTLLKRGESTLRKDIAAGRLKATYIGRQIRISPKALREFLAENTRKTATRGARS